MEEERKAVAEQLRQKIDELLPLLLQADNLNLRVSIKEFIEKPGARTVDRNGQQIKRISVEVSKVTKLNY